MAITLNTPVGRLSYPSLFKARSMKQQDGSMSTPKFGAVLILDPKDCDKLKAAIIAAAKEKWGDKAVEGLAAGRLRNPLRDGKIKEDTAYHGKLFIGGNGVDKPGLVDVAGNPVTDPAAVYPGMYARFNISLFTYDMPQNRGVGVGLNHVQLVAAGERLDSRQAPDKAFGDGEKFDGYDTSTIQGEANPFD